MVLRIKSLIGEQFIVNSSQLTEITSYRLESRFGANERKLRRNCTIFEAKKLVNGSLAELAGL